MSTNKMATKADLQELYQRILPYLGGMPEVLANKFSKGDMYSADEKMIGQWVDEKPLYQKSLYVPFSSFTTSGKFRVFNLVNNLPSGTTIRNVFGYAKSANYGMCTIGASNFGGNNDFSDEWAVGFYYNQVSVYSKYSVSRMDNEIKPDLYVTVQYTKDADSAVSIGNDTDYSTDEKIIGTWIDGKPLWQKTFMQNVDINAGTTIYIGDLSNLNIDFGIITSYAIKQTTGYFAPVTYFDVWLRVPQSNIGVTNKTEIRQTGTMCVTIQYTKTS